MRNFVAAAVRATRAGTACTESAALPRRPDCAQDTGQAGRPCRKSGTGGGEKWNNPVRIFVGIVRRGLWHHITQEQEDRAVQALKRFREKRTGAHEKRKAKAVVNAADFCRAGEIVLSMVRNAT